MEIAMGGYNGMLSWLIIMGARGGIIVGAVTKVIVGATKERPYRRGYDRLLWIHPGWDIVGEARLGFCGST